MNLRADIMRMTWAAGDPRRADERLRQFARREGDAVFCRRCDGGGRVLTERHRPNDPIKTCPRCHGEGLEPAE